MKHLLCIIAIICCIGTGCKKESATDAPPPPPPGPVTVIDADGNIYPTVKIGSQVWMAENLRTTKAANGAALTHYAPNNDEANVTEYGRLYHWADALAAVPAGWRLPTKEDWDALITQLGGATNGGAKLKHTAFSPVPANGNAGTNESGFGAKGAGYRVPLPSGGLHIFAFRAYTGFWSATDIGSGTQKYCYTLGIDRANVAQETYSTTMGFSVRFIKN